MHHICPFDDRLEKIENEEPTNFMNGCYYSCSLRSRRSDKENLFDLVERARNVLQSGSSEDTFKRLNDSYFNS